MYLFGKDSLHKDMSEESVRGVLENFHPLYVVPLDIHLRIVSILTYFVGPSVRVN